MDILQKSELIRCLNGEKVLKPEYKLDFIWELMSDCSHYEFVEFTKCLKPELMKSMCLENFVNASYARWEHVPEREKFVNYLKKVKD